MAGDLRAVLDEVAPRAVSIAEELGDGEQASRACVLALQSISRFGGAAQRATPESVAWTNRLDRLAPDGTVHRVWADANRGLSLMLTSGLYAEAWERRTRALALARTLDDLDALSVRALLRLR